MSGSDIRDADTTMKTVPSEQRQRLGETASNAKHGRRNGRRCDEGFSRQFRFVVDVTWTRAKALLTRRYGRRKRGSGRRPTCCWCRRNDIWTPRRLGEKGVGDRYVDSPELFVGNLGHVGGVKRSHVHDSLYTCDRCPANAGIAKIADDGRPSPGHPVDTSNDPSRCLGCRSNGGAESTRAASDEDRQPFARGVGAVRGTAIESHGPDHAAFALPRETNYTPRTQVALRVPWADAPGALRPWGDGASDLCLTSSWIDARPMCGRCGMGNPHQPT